MKINLLPSDLKLVKQELRIKKLEREAIPKSAYPRREEVHV